MRSRSGDVAEWLPAREGAQNKGWPGLMIRISAETWPSGCPRAKARKIKGGPG